MTYVPGPQSQQPHNPSYGQGYGPPAQQPVLPGYAAAGFAGSGYYNPYSPYGGMPPRRHSVVGVISFTLGLLSVIGLIGLFVLAVALNARAGGEIDEKSPQALMLGLLVIGGMFLAVLGVVLGIVAVMQRDSKKILGILGLVCNAGVLLVVVALMAIGLAMK